MITFEPLVYLIRIGDQNTSYGKPYTAICTAIKIDQTTVRITGLNGDVTIKQYAALEAELKRLGFENVIWERSKNGSFQESLRKIK